MRSLLIAASISILFFTSCDNNSHADIDTSLPATTNSLAPSDANSLNNNLSETGVLPAAQGIQLEQGVQQATPEVYQAAGLNPPHGQPGHDCAIAVGAPLNGNPAPNAAPSSAPTMNFPAATPSPTPARASSGQRLNPPHGQPGHDCAVRVGAPLG